MTTNRTEQRQTDQAKIRIRHAIQNLLNNKMFFGALTIHMLPAIPDPERQTLASDGKNLRYNPEWVNQATADQIVYAIARTALAIGLTHHIRRGNRDYDRWQEASRLVTLPFMREHKFPTREEGLRMPIEKAYAMIPQTPPTAEAGAGKESQQNQTNGEDSKDQASSQAKGEAKSEASNQAKDEASNQAKGEDKKQDQQPSNTGHYQQGEVMDAPEAPPDQSGNQSQQRPSPTMNSRSEAQRKQEKQEQRKWTTTVKQAIHMSKARGYNPGSIEETINETLSPQLDWTEVLRDAMNEYASEETNINYPNRRTVYRKIHLPGKHNRHIAHLCFAIDSSASMRPLDLAKAWAEIKSAVTETQPEYIRIIQCDTRIVADTTYDAYNMPDDLTAKGRGGTKFTPVFDLIDEGENPSILVYMTDLQCEQFPQETPEYPVVWICTEPDKNQQVPFGELINLDQQ